MTNWWQKLADFLHTANLIPLVVANKHLPLLPGFTQP